MKILDYINFESRDVMFFNNRAMIVVTLPDGKCLNYEQGVTCHQVAKDIAISLGKRAIAAIVNEKLVDLSTTIVQSSNIRLILGDVEDTHSLEIIRHDCAHLLAQAVKMLYPDTQVTIGPVIENGFYYDFYREKPFNLDDLLAIETKMREIAKKNYPIAREVWSKQKAKDFFASIGENFKVQIIDQIPDTEDLSVYSQGDFVDLCRGPHAPNTSFIKHFKLLKLSGSHWRGDQKGAALQRIYGTAWIKEESLSRHLLALEEAEKRDHRNIGRELQLFHQQEEAPGDIFWHPKGWAIFVQIQNYIREKLETKGYQEIKTPIMIKKKLWELSGHWDKFKDNMFVSNVGEEEFAVKPMSCPGHIQVFKSEMRSYKDLPLRFSEFGHCHRCEPSGSLHGIMRVRSFTQDDAHIFCTEDQITEETISFCDLLFQIYKDFGFVDVKIKFSDRPQIRAGEDSVWDRAESALKKAIDSLGMSYDLNSGEGAFYGPKLEFVLTDAIGRDWQCGTLQVDFVLPERLDAAYIDTNSNKTRPVMLHRAILGSFERFMGILIEHYSGKLPLWIAPVQAVVCGINNGHDAAVLQIVEKLKLNGIRAMPELQAETIGYKIRKHSLLKVPYILVVGDKEIKNNTIAVRTMDRHGEVLKTVDDFIANCQHIIDQKLNNYEQ